MKQQTENIEVFNQNYRGGGREGEGRTLRVGNSKKLRKPFSFFDEVNSRKQYLFVVISSNIGITT